MKMLRIFNKKWLYLSGILFMGLLILVSRKESEKEDHDDLVIFAEAQPRSFHVEVHTMGELEAAKSIIIASTIRGDQGKVISLIPDGVTVKPGELLVKMDPTPFEEKASELNSKIKDQRAIIRSLQQTLDWEKNQTEVENQTALNEAESAQLELDKVVKGDGPLELFRLESAMQKALVKYDELNAYSEDLIKMESEGFINRSERKQAEKKLKEEKEAYENAKLQFETYSNHVHPMVVKKAETNLRRAHLRVDEVLKSGQYKIEKAYANLQQAKQFKKDLTRQLEAALQELEQSEIRASSSGMVVLREEYRAGQKRKPRVGDILVKNQPILDLPDLKSMIVKTKVREVDLYKVQIGKKAIIEVDAYPQVYFQGDVQSIGVLALSDLGRSGGEKYFEVKLAMADSDARLRPGMTARITILADNVENSLAVPVPAIFEDQKKLCCYIQTPNGYQLTSVKTGASNEEWVEIKEGIKPGDKVALSAPSKKQIALK